MAHLATMMEGFHPFRRNTTVFQKTVAINDFYRAGPQLLILSARFSRKGARMGSWPRWSADGGPRHPALGL